MNEEGRAFRAAVRGGGAHLPQTSLESAIKWHEEQGWVGNSHLANCIQLAGRFSDHAKVEQEAGDNGRTSRQSEVHFSRPPLGPTPLATQMGTDWVRDFEPWARAVRERLFARPDPPFAPERWDLAAKWIDEEIIRAVEGAADNAAAIETEEYRKRKERAHADAAWLSKQSGLPFRLTLAPLPTLAYKTPRRVDQVSIAIRETVRHVVDAVKELGEDAGITLAGLTNRMKLKRATVLGRVAQARKAGFLRNVESRKGYPHQLRPADPLPTDGAAAPDADDGQDVHEAEVKTVGVLPQNGPLMTLAVATEAMAALSGFEPYEVTHWVLTGESPAPARASVRRSVVIRHRPKPEPLVVEEGAEPSNLTDPLRQDWAFRAPRVTVEFHTSDIRNEDLRTIRKEIDRAWAKLAGEEDYRARSRQAKEEARRDFRRGVRKTLKLPPLPPVPLRRGRLTEKDVQLEAVVREIGGLPEKPTAVTWEKIRRCYAKAGYGSIKADSLRKRWKRLASKPRSPSGSSQVMPS